MAQNNNGLIVFGSIVVLGAVGYYLWSKSKMSKGAGSLEPTPDGKTTEGGVKETPKDTTKEAKKYKQGKGTTINQSTQNGYVIPSALDSVEKIQTFQAWLDTFYPKWYNGKKLGESSKYYGTLGTNTKSAWESYGKAYLKWEKDLENSANATKRQQEADEFNKKYAIGKRVIASITFRAVANQFRNGDWFNTDKNGNQLPSKEFKATSNLGTIYEKTKDGNLIVKLDEYFTDGSYFADNYSYIKVAPRWIK